MVRTRECAHSLDAVNRDDVTVCQSRLTLVPPKVHALEWSPEQLLSFRIGYHPHRRERGGRRRDGDRHQRLRPDYPGRFRSDGGLRTGGGNLDQAAQPDGYRLLTALTDPNGFTQSVSKSDSPTSPPQQHRIETPGLTVQSRRRRPSETICWNAGDWDGKTDPGCSSRIGSGAVRFHSGQLWALPANLRWVNELHNS